MLPTSAVPKISSATTCACFFEDGKASCAYVYPYRVNGVRAGFYDPFANDQDWALVYYLLANDDL